MDVQSKKLITLFFILYHLIMNIELLKIALRFKEKIPIVFHKIDSTKTEYEKGGCNIIWFSNTEKHNSTIELRFLNSTDYSFQLGRYYTSYPNMEEKEHIFR